MYHATINGKKKLDIEWDGKSEWKLDGQDLSTDVSREDAGKSHWIVKDRSYNVEIVQMDVETKEAIIKVNGTVYNIHLKDRYDDLLQSLGMEVGSTRKLSELKAPMPGMVLDILVKENDSVEKDTPLIILEAMKMENVIKSPAAGIVKRINATKGNAVEKNNVLIEFA